jgi:hypothetical protein
MEGGWKNQAGSPHLLQNEIGHDGINRSINLNNIFSPLLLSIEYKKDVNCKTSMLFFSMKCPMV